MHRYTHGTGQFSQHRWQQSAKESWKLRQNVVSSLGLDNQQSRAGGLGVEIGSVQSKILITLYDCLQLSQS